MSRGRNGDIGIRGKGIGGVGSAHMGMGCGEHGHITGPRRGGARPVSTS